MEAGEWVSNKDLARRTDAEVCFDGVDISESLRKYLLTITYTDEEEGETDDLQIRIEDRDDVWLTKWLNKAIQAAIATEPSKGSTYKITAKSGLNVRSGPGTKHSRVGALVYGAQITVNSISNNWASITYSGKKAYVSAKYLTLVSSSSGSNDWAVGDSVIATGQPQYSSYGSGTPGKAVTNYSGNITNLNLKSGIPYPIHVGYLGWFSISQVKKATADNSSVDSSEIKGMSIQARFMRKNWTGNGKDDILDCGQFELDSISADGPPSTITIKGTSLSYSTQTRQTKKSKAWESTSLSKIANEITSSNGMTCMYESKSDPHYTRVEQITMSDIAFLSKLCRNAGISLKSTNNILILFDQADYEKKKEVFKITRGVTSYTKYRLDSGVADKKYTSCRVSYTNPSLKKTIRGTAYIEGYEPKKKTNQQLEITAKVSSVAEAQALAKKMLRMKNKYEYTASFTLPGIPKLLAGVTVRLKGWGAFDGKYIIKQAKHSIGSSGYTTQIKLRHVLEGY